MFATKNLFSGVACPYLKTCILPRCIFSHSDDKLLLETPTPHTLDFQIKDHPEENHHKEPVRFPKLEPGHKFISTQALHATEFQPLSLLSQDHSTKKRKLNEHRDISPPPSKRKTTFSTGDSLGKAPSSQRKNVTKNELKTPMKVLPEQESLNPRALKITAPASHDMRYRLLRALHEQLHRLNSSLLESANGADKELILSDQALIKKALDMEEEATASPSIYSNLVKNKILVYKRMSVKKWRDERSEESLSAKLVISSSDNLASKATDSSKLIQTGLSPDEELDLLHLLHAPPEGLSKCGYVMEIPTDAEIEGARRGLETAKGWEVCDRCKTRFQVFPQRREDDGALASGGKCTYHFGKPCFPERSSTEPKARREKRYRCCGESVGDSPGCTVAESHVFKVSEVKRLAAVLNFEKTPENDRNDSRRPICIDGEMCYTVHGLELVRLTATSWPDHHDLFDVLVRPIGPILDLNSRYSGVYPHDMADAPIWNPATSAKTSRLHIVASPAEARSLLFSYMSPMTPLIGHGLENDLNAARIIHSTIIDTALLFPHKAGLPYRNGLKMLMHTHLNKHIQVVVEGGVVGHDSKEDATAAGDLVRFALGERWKSMKRKGWTLDNRELKAPVER